jgi:hypothetical protein
MHFNFDGTPGTYLLKPVVWVIPLLQLIIALAAYETGPSAHQSADGVAIFVDCILAICWRLQMVIIHAAKPPGSRAPVLSLLVFFILAMSLGLASVSR